MSEQDEGLLFERWAGEMHGEYEAFLRQAWEAMKAARKGHWIADTEEVVRQAGAEFRCKALERLLRMRIEREQKSFSPSGRLEGQGRA